MPRQSKYPLTKVTLNIVEGDKELLAEFFPGLGWGVAARLIIHKECLRLLELRPQEEDKE